MRDYDTPIFTEEERLQRRAEREAARKKKKQAKRRRMLQRLLPVFAVVAALSIILITLGDKQPARPEASLELEQPTFSHEDPTRLPGVATEVPQFTIFADANTVHLGEDLPSKHAVVIDLQTGAILAEKDSDTIISPASMTKILTLLVAAEHVADRLDETYTMTIDISDYCYVNDCSVVGFEPDEVIPVRELLYGTILPSGADAAVCLANFVAGSHEAFVEMMNQKAEELGLSETAHFTNCVGLYDPQNVCTVKDMALILKAAMENELCQEVLNARTYKTAPTPQHPEGQVLSNLFLRRIEDHLPEGFSAVGAKTGFVNQSGSCAASCGRDSDGNLYICVTGNAFSSWRAIYDHVDLYTKYCA